MSVSQWTLEYLASEYGISDDSQAIRLTKKLKTAGFTCPAKSVAELAHWLDGEVSYNMTDEDKEKIDKILREDLLSEVLGPMPE